MRLARKLAVLGPLLAVAVGCSVFVQLRCPALRIEVGPRAVNGGTRSLRASQSPPPSVARRCPLIVCSVSIVTPGRVRPRMACSGASRWPRAGSKRRLELASGTCAKSAWWHPLPCLWCCVPVSSRPGARYADRGPESRALPPVGRATYWQGRGRRTSCAPAMLVPLPTAHLGRALSSRRPGEQTSRQAGPKRRPRAHRCRLGSSGSPRLPSARGLLGARQRRWALTSARARMTRFG